MMNNESEIVFLNSVFPILSETFLFEQYTRLLALQTSMAIVSSNRVDDSQIHPKMRPMQAQVDYLCQASMQQIIRAHGAQFLRHPLNYLHCLFRLLFVDEKLKISIAHFTGAVLVLQRYKKMRWVHSHFTYGATAIAMWIKRLADIPYSLTLHGADLTFDNPADLGLKLIEAKHIFSISDFNLHYVAQNFAKVDVQKSSVIPLGVSFNEGPNVSKKEKEKEKDKQLKLLNVGRLSEHKAQHLLIEACAQLKNQGLDFKCYIIGDGPKRDLLAQLIQQKNLSEQVELLGARYHDEVLAWYAKVDIFVLSSITEGMPIVIMEAMQSNVVVVAPDLSGIPELLDNGQAGLLFQPNDIPSLMATLKTAIEGTVDLDEVRKKASEHILKHFDVDKNSLKFQSKLLSLIPDKQPTE